MHIFFKKGNSLFFHNHTVFAHFDMLSTMNLKHSIDRYHANHKKDNKAIKINKLTELLIIVCWVMGQNTL